MPKLLLLVLLSIASLWAQRGEYALVLDSPPLAAQVRSRKDLRSAAAQNRLETIRAAQQSLRQVLAERSLSVTGSSTCLPCAATWTGQWNWWGRRPPGMP